jgi:hypothetical protein
VTKADALVALANVEAAHDELLLDVMRLRRRIEQLPDDGSVTNVKPRPLRDLAAKIRIYFEELRK